jgi:heat-inducible transcriptional repressor
VAEPIINERAQALLKGLVELYIREGQPVGSSKLLRETNLDVSPATVRNVIADLESMGLVESPHTSAGRIPTDKGYRLFIDNLLILKPLDAVEIEKFRENINTELDTKGLLSQASSLLSGVTKMAGVVTVPHKNYNIIEHIEFFPLSDNRVLAILVFRGQDVQNRIINTSRAYKQDELQRITNFLNAEFAGQDIADIRSSIVRQLKDTKDHMDKMMLQAIEMANNIFQRDTEKHDFVMAGETNLMDYDEMSNITRLRQLFDAFNEKQGILQLLDQSLSAPGVQIYIGNESGYDVFDGCSMVTATYTNDEEEVIGALGVIGPTRMAYDRVIPIVDVTAKLLSRVMKHRI